MTAVPNAGYHFVSWSDGVLTAARTDTNVHANISVTASFALVAATDTTAPITSNVAANPWGVPINTASRIT